MDYLKNISFAITLFIIGAIFILLGLSGGFAVSGYGIQIQDNWARLLSSFIGLIMVGVAIYIETKLKQNSQKPVIENPLSKKGSPSLMNVIDARGRWTSKTKIGKIVFQEAIFVDEQQDGKIRGVLRTTPREVGDPVLEFDIQGVFINSNTIRYWFEPRDKGSFVDYGVGILEIEDNYNNAHGKSVIYGVISEETGADKIGIASFDLKRD